MQEVVPRDLESAAHSHLIVEDLHLRIVPISIPQPLWQPEPANLRFAHAQAIFVKCVWILVIL